MGYSVWLIAIRGKDSRGREKISMRLFPRPYGTLPEEEQIARLRRVVAWWDRWGRWLAVVNVGLLIAIFLVLRKLIPILLDLFGKANPDLAMAGFCIGILFGFIFGHLIHSALSGIVTVFTGLRSERMILKYYDELHGDGR